MQNEPIPIQSPVQSPVPPPAPLVISSPMHPAPAIRFVHGLSPFGPIFGKELRVAARRRRNYLLRVAYLGGLLLFLLFAWSITANIHYRGGASVAQRAQSQQQLGYYFFAFFSMFCIGAMGLIGPVLTSTAINGEKQ